MNIAKMLLKIGAVTLKMDPPYRWVSGIFSPIYCDNRLLISYPEERRMVVDGFAEMIKREGIKFDVVAGIASSGIPHAAWLAERLSKPMIYIRKKNKGYGRGKMIEGKLEKGSFVLIVEDLVSTAGSLVNGIETVREAGGKVENCIAIFTYEMEKAKRNMEEVGCNLLALSNFSSLLKIAKAENYLGGEYYERALEWSRDPEGWGERMGFE
ncbi:MAG: orotate phosphoribosyltransferase [Candidatus Aenigmarchaeota archaeon]|nr:orotate phosphoribosyltransferase [Candidatus Aenigmarchaeota archaeon]